MSINQGSLKFDTQNAFLKSAFSQKHQQISRNPFGNIQREVFANSLAVNKQTMFAFQMLFAIYDKKNPVYLWFRLFVYYILKIWLQSLLFPIECTGLVCILSTLNALKVIFACFMIFIYEFYLVQMSSASLASHQILTET